MFFEIMIFPMSWILRIGFTCLVKKYKMVSRLEIIIHSLNYTKTNKSYRILDQN